jgi:DNA-binding transcriptional ArsR family regulator
MVDAFAALADPTRRRVVELLARRGEMTAGEIAESFASARPTISRHLGVLRDAGVVRVRPVAQERRYALEPKSLERVEAWAKRYRSFWTERLAALERLLEAE